MARYFSDDQDKSEAQESGNGIGRWFSFLSNKSGSNQSESTPVDPTLTEE
jgi:hypothetical protein